LPQNCGHLRLCNDGIGQRAQAFDSDGDGFAGLDDEARRDPDAIEALFKKLNAADEAERARRDLCG